MFSTTISMRWRDMDANNHVNNGVYATYLEEARLQWYQQTPQMQQWAEAHNVQFIVVAQSFKYMQAVTYPDNIIINMSVAKVGRTSIQAHYELYSQKNTAKAAMSAEVSLVFINANTGRPIKLPETIKALLADI